MSYLGKRKSAKAFKAGPMRYKKVRPSTKYYQRPAEEKKWFDTKLATTTISAAGTTLSPSLNLIAEGAGESNRIGRKCTVAKIQIRGKFQLPGTTSSLLATDRVRFIVALDKQANGAAATLANYLETVSFDSYRDLANVGRFQTLFDQSWTITSTAGAGADGVTDVYVPKNELFSMSKTCSIPLEFSAGTGVIAELRSNNILIFGITQSGQITTDYQVRIRFFG